MSSLVICSAASFETDPLVAGLTRGNVTFSRVLCGIGAIESAIVASSLRGLISGRDVVFVGTAGIIGSLGHGQLFMAKRVSLAPFDVRNHQTELVGNFDPPLALHTPQWNIPLADVAGSLGVSVSADNGPAYDGYLETMELYSVARAWTPFARSFTGIFFATNSTGPSARHEWKNSFKIAAKSTAEALLPILTQQFRMD